MSDPTIQNLLGIPDVQFWKTNRAKEVPNACPSLLYGIELEIENVPNYEDLVVPGMHTVSDGSLRNNGREFITQPMSYSFLDYTLNRFFLKGNFTSANYSERTSVHVHANCLNLTIEQLTSVILLYQVFERLLYKYVGNDRDKNIFCVPLYETNITFDALQRIAENTSISGNILGLKKWMKYTGLNLLPLFSQGTIEFRHMAGTGDVKFILDWCNLIGSLFSYSLNHPLTEIKSNLLSLNTTSQYTGMLEAVFGKYTELLETSNYKYDLEEGVLNIKYIFLTARKTPIPVFIQDELSMEEPIQSAHESSVRIVDLLAQMNRVRDTPENRWNFELHDAVAAANPVNPVPTFDFENFTDEGTR